MQCLYKRAHEWRRQVYMHTTCGGGELRGGAVIGLPGSVLASPFFIERHSDCFPLFICRNMREGSA